MLCLALSLLALAPQAPGWEAAPTGLTVVCVNVGHGDGTVIRAPDGTVHVVDAGLSGMGTAAMIPVINRLAPTAFGDTFTTHYDFCHVGGMDELLQAFPFQLAHDRGDVNIPNTPVVTSYLAAAGTRRRTLQPGLVFQLGGGATLTVMAVNGFVHGGAVVPLTGTTREENSRSAALRLDYGNFSMWIAGDLHGGAGGTADVETPAAAACGDIDVYQVDHHGSELATNANLVASLKPELAVFSAEQNSRGSPTPQAIARLQASGNCRPLACTTPGMGALGFAVTGNLTISTDGFRYRATAQDDEFLDFFCDEVVGYAPAPGEIRISELQRDPVMVPDLSGEYIELTNIGARPVSLRELRLATGSGAVVFRTSLMLLPGRPVLALADGYNARNGGVGLGVVWPPAALGLGNNSDTVRLSRGPNNIDQITYAAGFAGGPGVAAEIGDLQGSPNPGNYVAATGSYGLGDLGTPRRRNDGDTSALQATVVVDTEPSSLLLHAGALSHGSQLSILGLALGTTPGFNFLGTHIPLNPDPLFLTSIQGPGLYAFMPREGYRTFFVRKFPNISGLSAFVAHVILDLGSNQIPTVSAPVPLVFP